MMSNKISIVGGGISGLVLGRALLSRGIPAVLYERDAARPRHGYQISLRASAYRHLLPLLDLNEDDFRHKTAVDGPIGGLGLDRHQNPSDPHFCVNRAKLEELLREGLDVRWEHKLTNVKVSENRLDLEFENGQKADTQTLVGAEGVHSQVRQLFFPNSKVAILPIAAYNGKRRLDPASFNKKFAPYMDGVNRLTHRTSNTLFQILVNERTNEKASISYIYSRPAQQENDPLFRPTRSIPGATNIPPEFFSEIATLTSLDQPFKEVFEPEAMKEDRLLNWLMRSVHVDSSDLEQAAQKRIVLLGDSAHHTAIIGSDGANQAIFDAIILAGRIAESENQIQPLQDFYKLRYDFWEQEVESSEERLAEMHGMGRSSML